MNESFRSILLSLCALVLASLVSCSLLCQQTIPSTLVKKDSIQQQDPALKGGIDSLGLRSTRVRFATDRNPKSGTVAMLLSAALPGAGQVYAERYWTIPIIWGFGVYFASQYKKMGDQYDRYRSEFTASVLSDTVSHQGNPFVKSIRDQYRDERDRFAIYLGLTYALNIIDAYVGASLFAFDVSDNLGGSVAIRMKIPIR
jgi:hypothetical protein